MWGMIATWRMAVEGITRSERKGRKGRGDIETAIREVEDFHTNPWDTADFIQKRWKWDGRRVHGRDTLDIGAVAAIKFCQPGFHCKALEP